jgi:hypothetical protein
VASPELGGAQRRLATVARWFWGGDEKSVEEKEHGENESLN